MYDVAAIFSKQYPELKRKHPKIFSLGIHFIRHIWREKLMLQYPKKFPYLSRIELWEKIFSDYHINLNLGDKEAKKIPLTGPLIVVCNHSMGIVDGIALLLKILKYRKNVKIVQGSILRDTLGFFEYSVEVDNLNGGIDRDVYKEIKSHLNHDGVLIIFPAGQVARLKAGKIQESPWNSGFYRFAKATNTPILPVNIQAKNSRFFYFLGVLCKPLSMLWVVPELFYHRHHSFHLHIGDILPDNHIKQCLESGDSELDIIESIRDACLDIPQSNDC